MARISKRKLKKMAERATRRASREEGQSRALSTQAKRAPNQAAAAALLRKHVSGLTRLKREFNDHLARTATKSEAEARKLRAKALKVARGRKAAIASMVAQHGDLLAELSQGDNEQPLADRYLINVPLDVAAYYVDVVSTSIAPNKNWAKFTLDVTKKRLWPSAHFRFVWANNTDKYKVITVNGYLVLHGYCDLWSDGGFFGGDRQTTFRMKPTLKVQDWTNDPYLYLGERELTAVNIGTNTGTVFDDADRVTLDVYRGYDMEQPLMLVRPRTTIGIIVSAQMYVYAGQNSGRVQADFATGPYGVGSPAVLVRVLS